MLLLKNLHAKSGDRRDLGLIPGWGRSSGGGHGNPFQYSCLENPMDSGAWWATVHGVTKSHTWLKWLSAHRPISAVQQSDTILHIYTFFLNILFHDGLVRRLGIVPCAIQQDLGVYSFFFFNINLFILIWRLITLEYCTGFAIHQHESATV